MGSEALASDPTTLASAREHGVAIVTNDHDLSRSGRFLWAVSPTTLRVLARAVYSFHVEREGPLPEPPYVVAANHFSHFDPPLVGAAVDEPIRFLALDQLRGVSVLFDRVLDAFGTIPLPRTGVPLGSLRTALGRLAAGEIVGVFPEGTRVRDWGEHSPKKGAAWLAMRAAVPFVPVAIAGTDRAFGVDNRLRWSRIRVAIGRPLEAANPSALTAAWEEWVTARLDDLRQT